MLNIHMIVHKLIEVDSTRKSGNVSASTYIYTYAFLNDVIYTHYFYIVSTVDRNNRRNRKTLQLLG